MMSTIHLSTPGVVRSDVLGAGQIGPMSKNLVSVRAAERFTWVAALSGHEPGDSINR